MSTKHGLHILLSGTLDSCIPLFLDLTRTGPTDLYSEHAPPTEIADIIHASYPLHLIHLVHQRKTKDLAEADK